MKVKADVFLDEELITRLLVKGVEQALGYAPKPSVYPCASHESDRILVDKSNIESLSFHLSEIKRVRAEGNSNSLCNKSCDIYTELCNKSAQIYKSVRINNSVNSAIKILEDIKNENNC